MFSYRVELGLTLELLALRHAQELFDAVDKNRDHLKPWMPWVGSTKSVDDVKAFITATLGQVANNNGFQTAIRADEKVIGVVGMHKIDWGNRSTSLGYWVSENAQGKGIMTKACAAYLAHAFSELDLHRVEIRCATENSRSRAIAERLGFSSEGIIRDAEWVNGGFVSHVVYGLLSDEWTNKSG